MCRAPFRVFLVCLMSSMERCHSSSGSGSPPSSRGPKSLLVSCDKQARNPISSSWYRFRPESSFMGCGQWKGQSAIAQTNMLVWRVFSQHTVGALGKHCKWAGWGSMQVAQGCMAAGVAGTARLPHTLKPPEAQVLVHLDKGFFIHHCQTQCSHGVCCFQRKLSIEGLWGVAKSHKIWGHSIYLKIIHVSTSLDTKGGGKINWQRLISLMTCFAYFLQQSLDLPCLKQRNHAGRTNILASVFSSHSVLVGGMLYFVWN